MQSVGSGNPIGAEIRVGAGGEFIRSETWRNPLALVELAAMWKAQFQEKGGSLKALFGLVPRLRQPPQLSPPGPPKNL